MKLSTHGSVAAIVLASALGLSLAGPHRAQAAPKPFAAPADGDLGVSILSPDPHVTLAGLKPVEISAFYQGSPANQIVAIELFIDGAKAATKTLDVPETRGVVSFLINASQISNGLHKVVVRATAADQEVTSARTSFTFGQPDSSPEPTAIPALPQIGSPAVISNLAPTLHLIDPTSDGKVQGVITLHVEATDPSGKPPYVSLFIDKTFKTLRNYAPYEFEWDTTSYTNGYHTIEAFGYNDSPNVGHARVMRLYVNNPGGETGIRHDLLDAPKSVASKSVKLPARKMLKTARVAAKKRTLLTETKVATLLPRPRSTQEIVRQLVSGAGALHFGSLNFATELSSPFVADKPVTIKSVVPNLTRAAQPMRVKSLRTAKPMIAKPMIVEKPIVIEPMVTEKPIVVKPMVVIQPMRRAKPLQTTLQAKMLQTEPLSFTPVDTLSESRASSEATRLAKSALKKIGSFQRIASVRLPETELSVPFIAVPHLLPLMPATTDRAPSVQVHVAPHERQLVRTVIKPVLKMHILRVHLPAGLGSLLRSVGQTTLGFNQTTVTLDRPLTAQDSVVFGPLRQIFEQGGGTLTWQSRTGTVHAKSATKDILLTVGSKQAIVNAKEVMLDGKPYLLMGRTMVPVSFIAAALDADVQFDAATGHLLVTSRK